MQKPATAQDIQKRVQALNMHIQTQVRPILNDIGANLNQIAGLLQSSVNSFDDANEQCVETLLEAVDGKITLLNSAIAPAKLLLAKLRDPVDVPAPATPPPAAPVSPAAVLTLPASGDISSDAKP